MADFPLLTLAGSPAERGLTHGRLAAERIRDGVEFYRGLLAADGLRGRPLARACARLAEGIEAFDAAMLAELEGIARGAGVSLAEVISLNARSELMRLADEGCTSVAVLPRDGGHALLAQNWDWHPSRAATGVVLRILPDEGPAILSFAEAGVLARCGLNELGLGVVGNALECEGGWRPGGVPVALLRRRILESATPAEAVGAVCAAARGTAVNHLIASAAGEVIDCETTPAEVYEVGAENGLLGHSNHFLAPRAQQELVDTGIARHPDTLARAPRIRELVAARRQPTVADLQAALRDHEGYPDAICRHATTIELRTWTTVASIVMDLDQRRLWVAAGPPCESTYREHRLKG